LFSLLAYQASLLVLGVLTDALKGTVPLPVRVNSVLVVWLPLMTLFVAALILMPVRTGVEHALLYWKSRELNGELTGAGREPANYALTTKLERPRVAHGRALALASALVLAVSGWQLFKQEAMLAAIEDGGVNLVRAIRASGMKVPLWGESPRPAIGSLVRRPNMVRLLLDLGADPNARVLIERGWVQPYQSDLRTTPLMSALLLDANAAARVLLESGADLNAQDSSGRNPLMLAAVYSPDSIDLLLDYGANVNKGTSRGTALLCAARYRGMYDAGLIDEKDLSARENVVARLLARGANVAARDEEGRTAPMLMSMEYRPDRVILPIAEALTVAGADINARDRNNRTPLMYAVRHRQRATVEFLLGHGADASARDTDGATALDLANRLGFTDIARRLSSGS
jgi:ankyrin repeat protein